MEITSKREENKQRRRAAIVEIATRSFLEQGYAATSMSAIADELGGSKATLWSHFASKEELFVAVVDEQVMQFSRELESTLMEERFSVDGLHRYCQRFLAKLMRQDGIRLFRLIVADGARFPEINAIFHVRAPARIQRAATAYLATQFAPEEAAVLARLINAAMVGYRSHALTRPEWPTLAEQEQFVDDFIAHLRLPAYEEDSETEAR
jgi:AcrR family transcriptional regulator